MENAFSVLRLLHQLIPGSDSDLTEFFAGEPPVISADSQDHKKQEKEEEREEEEEEREGDGERGERSGEGGSGDEALEPPKAKKSRSQVRALNVQTLQVSVSHASSIPISIEFYSMCVCICSLLYIIAETQKAFQRCVVDFS